MTRAGRSLTIMAAGAAVCLVTVQHAQARPKDPHPARATVSTARHVAHATDGAPRAGRPARSTRHDVLAASESRSAALDLDTALIQKPPRNNATGAAGTSGKPHTSSPTTHGKAKRSTKKTVKSGSTGTTNAGVTTPVPVGSTASNPGTASAQSATLPTVPPGSVAAFPPVPAPPGANGTSPQSESPGESPGTAPPGHPSANTPPADATHSRSAPTAFPLFASRGPSRSESLGLWLLLGGFGAATTAIVVAAGYRGRRRIG